MSFEFTAIEFWHWWVLAALLIAIEVVAPSTVLLWPGISAAVVGLVLLLMPELGWEMQVLAFAVLSIASLAVWRVFLRPAPGPDPASSLNRRGASYVGRRFTIEEPIVDGHGRLTVDDTTWRIEGEDMEAGAHVTVVALDGAVFKVERA